MAASVSTAALAGAHAAEAGQAPDGEAEVGEVVVTALRREATV